MGFSKNKPLVFFLVSIILYSLIANGCATSPVTGEQEFILFSDGDEVRIGKDFAAEYLQKADKLKDPKIQEYVDRIGQRVGKVSHRPNLPYSFTVINSNEVNAFTFPGGQVFIYTGLLERLDNEAQLAAVLGHEIGHSTAKHGIKKLQTIMGVNILAAIAGIVIETQAKDKNKEAYRFGAGATFTALNLIILGYGRENEHQADSLGAIYMTKAGYDPKGMPELLSKFGKLQRSEPGPIETLLATHPSPSSRIEAVDKQLPELYNMARAGNERLDNYRDRYVNEVLQRLETKKSETRQLLEKIIICRDVDKNGNPLGITKDFSVRDTKIVIHLTWRDLKGKHKVHIDWYDPKGNLYNVSDFPFEAKYSRMYTYHWQAEINKDAAKKGLRGEWKVQVKLNGIDVAAETFTIH